MIRHDSLEHKFRKMIQFDLSKGGGIIIAFIIICGALSVASPHFLNPENLLIVTRQTVFVMIIGFAMTFVIGMGGIDLSVGAILALCGVVTAKMLLMGYNIWFTVGAGLLLGTLIGMINGVLIAKFKLSDLIVTLGMMSILRGVIMVFTHGVPFFGLQISGFQFLSQGYIGLIPFPVIIAVLILLICIFLLIKTKFGRSVLSIGSNEEAAKLVGINIEQIKIIVYSLCGLFSAIAGILLASRLEAAMPEAGMGYELQVIAATVIGGTSLAGGRANLIGTVIGAMVMGVIQNGLNLLAINVFWHQVVIGGIILIAVGIDRFSQRKSD